MLKTYIIILLTMFIESFKANSSLPKIFVTIAVISLIYILYNKINVYFTKININSLKINNGYITIFIIFLCLLVLVIIPLYLRIFKIGANLDLKYIIYNTYYFLNNNKLPVIIIVIVFYSVLICLILLILTLLKRILFYNFLSAHIYFVALFKQEQFKLSFYENFCYKIGPLTHYFPDKFMTLICYVLYKFIKKKQINYTGYDQEYAQFISDTFAKINYYKHKDLLSLYLIISSILYDIILNNMILNKLYFVLPLIFIFYLLQKWSDVIRTFELSYCSTLHTHFTQQIISIKNDTIFYNNGDCTDINRLKEINQLLLNIYKKTDEDIALYNISHRPFKNITIKLFAISSLVALFYCINKNISFSYSLLNIQNLPLEAVFCVLLLIQVSCLFFVRLYFFRYVNIIIGFVIALIFVYIYIMHSVPLLYNEILFDSFNIKLMTVYSYKEKLFYIQEYIKYLYLDKESKEYILYILKITLTQDHIELTTILELHHYINNLIYTFFDTKSESQKFVIEAIKIYNQEINEKIFTNIKNSKDIWMDTGFGDIADDLFKN